MLSQLRVTSAAQVLAPHWDESEASLPEATPHFLTPEAVRLGREVGGLPPEVEPLLQQVADQVRRTPALLHLAWHCHQLLFAHPDYPSDQIRQWPSLEATLGDDGGVFYILVALAMVPLTFDTHRRLGIPEEITRNTCARFVEPVDTYRSRHGGRWGIDLRVVYWHRLYPAGQLFGLGRMEYMVQPFRGRLRAYRNRETHEVIALAEDGVVFTEDGLIDVEATPEELARGWTSRLEISQERVTGCPISPLGFALRQKVELPLNQWRQVLAPGDGLLDMHIPAGGGMTPERCQASMQQALEFFPRYLPERRFVGFGCGSWILNPELATIYSPDSNMVKWQRELYLFPYPTPRRAGLYFMFGEDEVDPATAPRDTSLRRAVLDHLAAGGRLIVGGMFMLTDDFGHYGTQFYRTHFPQWLLDRQQARPQGRESSSRVWLSGDLSADTAG